MRHVLSSLSNVDGAATDSDPAPPDVVPFEPVLTSASNGWLRLNWDGVRVDAEPLFDIARSHPSAIESLPIERLEQGAVIDVASLFGDCDHGYVGAIRHELRAAHTESCTRLAHAALQSGDNMIAVHWARQGLSADPYREDRHQIAIRGLDRAGRPGEAGEQFATCRRLLIEDLVSNRSRRRWKRRRLADPSRRDLPETAVDFDAARTWITESGALRHRNAAAYFPRVQMADPSAGTGPLRSRTRG